LHNVRTQHFSLAVQEGLPHLGLVKGRALRMSWAGFAAVRVSVAHRIDGWPAVC